MRSSSDLRDYQEWMIDLLLRKPELFIALDMGMGKTAICLYALRRMMYLDFRYCLIVAPLNVAEHTWPDECEQWKELRPLRKCMSIITGTEKQRVAAASRDCPIHIVNKENLPWLVNFWRKEWPYDMCIVDESTVFKSWTIKTDSGRLTRTGAMAAVRQYIDRMVLLTGTPSPNGLIDLGGQMFILDGGERLGAKKTAFIRRWFDLGYNGFGYEPKDFAFDQIMGRVKDVMYSLRARDYIDLPPQIFQPVYVDLPKKIMKQYREFEASLYSEAYDVEAVNRGVLTNKLLQFANGFMYRNNDDETRDTIPIHDLKLDALDRIIEEANGKSVMVAYQFENDVEQITKAYKNAVVYDKRDKHFFKDWNDRRIRLALAHPAQIGHGTNIQFGGNMLAWYGLTWNLEHWQQFNERFPRSGQKEKICYSYPIIARGTNDETVYRSMQTKGATQNAVNSAVRARVRGGYEDR